MCEDSSKKAAVVLVDLALAVMYGLDTALHAKRIAPQIAILSQSCLTLKLPLGETFKTESFNMIITSFVGERAVSTLVSVIRSLCFFNYFSTSSCYKHSFSLRVYKTQ